MGARCDEGRRHVARNLLGVRRAGEGDKRIARRARLRQFILDHCGHREEGVRLYSLRRADDDLRRVRHAGNRLRDAANELRRRRAHDDRRFFAGTLEIVRKSHALGYTHTGKLRQRPFKVQLHRFLRAFRPHLNLMPLQSHQPSKRDTPGSAPYHAYTLHASRFMRHVSRQHSLHPRRHRCHRTSDA